MFCVITSTWHIYTGTATEMHKNGGYREQLLPSRKYTYWGYTQTAAMRKTLTMIMWNQPFLNFWISFRKIIVNSETKKPFLWLSQNRSKCIGSIWMDSEKACEKSESITSIITTEQREFPAIYVWPDGTGYWCQMDQKIHMRRREWVLVLNWYKIQGFWKREKDMKPSQAWFETRKKIRTNFTVIVYQYWELGIHMPHSLLGVENLCGVRPWGSGDQRTQVCSKWTLVTITK